MEGFFWEKRQDLVKIRCPSVRNDEWFQKQLEDQWGFGMVLSQSVKGQSFSFLQEVQSMGDIAVNAPTVQEEEAAWTKMLERFAGLPDIEVRVRCVLVIQCFFLFLHLMFHTQQVLFKSLRQPRQFPGSSGQVGGGLERLQPGHWAGPQCSRSTFEPWSCLWILGPFGGGSERLWCGVATWLVEGINE